jgi:hypothetical protein
MQPVRCASAKSLHAFALSAIDTTVSADTCTRSASGLTSFEKIDKASGAAVQGSRVGFKVEQRSAV